jgi:hypothetical protein
MMLHRKHQLTVRGLSATLQVRAEVGRFRILHGVRSRRGSDMPARTCKSVEVSCTVLTLTCRAVDPGLD